MNIHQRLAKAMERVTYIQKDKKSGMNYSIVSHDVVTAKVRPALLESGIVYYPVDVKHTQNGNRTEVAMTVRFVNAEKPEDFFDVQSFGYGIDSQDKGPGKAMSYAVKYALLKTLGLETGDDPDHDQQTEHESGLFGTLTHFIDMSTTKEMLDEALQEIKNKSGMLQKHETQRLRVAYANKLKELNNGS